MNPDMTKSPLLEISNASVCFQGMPVLHHASLCVLSHQVVAIVGPNGAGKTTLLKAVAGLISLEEGRITFDGMRIDGLNVSDIVRRGVVYVPEGMSVFPDLTVLENLEIGAYLNRGAIPERLEMVFGLFPELKEKRYAHARTLSGGQQRMVTLARGLMSGARLLLLDDPFLGLSPKIIMRFCETFRLLRRNGVTLFIAGQHVRRILNVADLAYLIEEGSVTLSGKGPDILVNSRFQQVLFGLEANP